ncbi:GNAT family N-acetyltransferase [Polyangium aurulentum]|uniref:GNAT family N-acetyltransferase n=1 Tax=Polyangium aurulentum TaxID=2567896 RepID=UPI0010AEBFC3|nr:GNAT family protein [Polyangium aurulentum]UQA54875.1 GNAT family N-acetyltransferase [Polyangium aurulentum]
MFGPVLKEAAPEGLQLDSRVCCCDAFMRACVRTSDELGLRARQGELAAARLTRRGKLARQTKAARLSDPPVQDLPAVKCTDPILLDLPDALEGPRVRVRPYQPGDGSAFFRAIDAHREALSTWLGWLEQYPSVEPAEAYVRRQAASWLLRESFVASLWLKESGEYIGGAGFHLVDWRRRRVELGFYLVPSFEGRGLAHEAVSLLLGLAFDHLDMRRVEAQCDAENSRSARLLQRLGFILEGRRRQDTIDGQGRFRDTLLFGLLTSVEAGH